MLLPQYKRFTVTQTFTRDYIRTYKCLGSKENGKSFLFSARFIFKWNMSSRCNNCRHGYSISQHPAISETKTLLWSWCPVVTCNTLYGKASHNCIKSSPCNGGLKDILDNRHFTTCIHPEHHRHSTMWSLNIIVSTLPCSLFQTIQIHSKLLIPVWPNHSSGFASGD